MTEKKTTAKKPAAKKATAKKRTPRKKTGDAFSVPNRLSAIEERLTNIEQNVAASLNLDVTTPVGAPTADAEAGGPVQGGPPHMPDIVEPA